MQLPFENTLIHRLSANCSKLFWLEYRFGEYDLHDLVELDQMTAGVMIAADAETCQILTNRNAVSPLPNFCYACMFVYRQYTKQAFCSSGFMKALYRSCMILRHGQGRELLILTAAQQCTHTPADQIVCWAGNSRDATVQKWPVNALGSQV